jgi:hypothetical protein
MTPLYKLNAREIKAAVGVLAVTLIALLVVVALTVGDSRPGPEQGCIRSSVAGIVGSETISACGREAVQVCTRASQFTGARAETIVADCRTQGIEF